MGTIKKHRIIAELDRAIIEKKTVQDIDALAKALAAELSKAHSEKVVNALAEIRRQLMALPADATDADVDAILAVTDKHMGAPLGAETRSELDKIVEAAYAQGIAEVGVKPVFGAPDVKSLATLQEDLFFWSDHYYEDNVKDTLHDELTEYFEEGLTRDQLAKKIEVAFRGVADSGDDYYDLLADHTATKVREIGRLSGYDAAGIIKIVVRAQLDNRTSAICRALHGTVIETIYLQRQADRYLAACKTKNKEKIKKSWPWLGDKDAAKLGNDKAIAKAVKKGTVGMPPYHARCRTITVAHFES